MTGLLSSRDADPAGAPGRVALVANVVLFQLGWLGCVLGAARGMGHAGAALGIAIVVLHVLTAARPARDAALVGLALLIGVVADGAMLHAGWIVYADPGPLPALPPAWLMTLWALFAITLNRSLRWMRDRPLLAVALGALGGPLSYLGAARLGAVSLPSPAVASLALAVTWALVTPVLLALARRFDGVGVGVGVAGAGAGAGAITVEPVVPARTARGEPR